MKGKNTMTEYFANIEAINATEIGCTPHGTAKFNENESTLHIEIEMYDTPPKIEHWAHFHGFPDGKNATTPTKDQDTNRDGFIDLIETEPVSGTTMVPFDDFPQNMIIPHDGYPVADDKGYYKYEVDVPLAQLQAKFKEAFGTTDLQLDKRVVYIHGVPDSLELPVTVRGQVMGYDAHTTLPIAAGKIRQLK